MIATKLIKIKVSRLYMSGPVGKKSLLLCAFGEDQPGPPPYGDIYESLAIHRPKSGRPLKEWAITYTYGNQTKRNCPKI